MKAKISKIKFYNSVKASTKGGASTQLDYVDTQAPTHKMYDISIDGEFIKVFNKESEEITYSTVNNVIYFTLKD
jgi:hypothetical protein